MAGTTLYEHTDIFGWEEWVMKCRCIKAYRDDKVSFKVNEIYDAHTVLTSGRYPPVYRIYNSHLGQKVFDHSEFREHFRITA